MSRNRKHQKQLEKRFEQDEKKRREKKRTAATAPLTIADGVFLRVDEPPTNLRAARRLIQHA
jgi:hypothetical protein